MTPIEWNDSEPGFPDFLPPAPTHRRLTEKDAAWRLKGILEAAGVDADIRTEYAYVKFPDGAVFSEAYLSIDAAGYTPR
jgi:hypothetical protein